MARLPDIKLVFLAVIATTILLLSSRAPYTNTRHLLEAPSHLSRDRTFTSNLTKRAFEKCDWNAAAEAVKTKPFNQLNDVCEKPLAKGTDLNCIMHSTSAVLWASKWTDSSILQKYGYTYQVAPDYSMDRAGLGKAFEKLGISGSKEQWSRIGQTHTIDGEVSNIRYPRTGAAFVNAVNTESGVLVAMNNENPDAINKDRVKRSLPAILPVPPLKQWSDIVFLGLKIFDKTVASKIRHIFRLNVTNKETQIILGQVIGKEELADEDTWPGYEIKIEEIRAKAALGCPNAKGVAWFLGQHKSELGNRYVDQINVFACPDAMVPQFLGLPTQWCMYMHVADVVEVSSEISPSGVKEA